LKQEIVENPIKIKDKISVNQKTIDDFDKLYAQNCDNKKMSLKARGLSSDNPFNENHKPPIEHLLPEKILEKPGYIKNLFSFHDSNPLAGKLSVIGKEY
jgi:hypothetical protein